MRKLLLAASLGCCLSLIASAEDWENPANRYKDAYKQYLDAPCPIAEDNIKNFVWFSRDREALHKEVFLSVPRFCGAQVMYTWKELEPEKGKYDFSAIRDDYEFLKSNGKKLFVQLQDATFNPKYNSVPEYLLTDKYDGGIVKQVDDDGKIEGWVAKRWNAKVQERFAALLMALGKEFDGKIEGINLQESSIGVNSEIDPSISPKGYVEALKTNMLALKKAFPTSTTIQYANFMPGEWLPWKDEGYLRSIYEYGEEIGVGLAGPDLMFTRKGNLNHTIAMMHEHEYTTPLGIAIQDGNYIGKTGADKDYDEYLDEGQTGHKNIVPVLHAFAKDFMKVDYIFWGYQEPYFSEDVVPCFK